MCFIKTLMNDDQIYHSSVETEVKKFYGYKNKCFHFV